MTNTYEKDDVLRMLDGKLLSQKYKFQLPKVDNGNVRCVNTECGGKKMPSMTVKDKPFLYHCKRCGEKGDALSIIAYFEGLDTRSDFKDVLAIGAEISGIYVPEVDGNEVTNNPKEHRAIKKVNGIDVFIDRYETTDKNIIKNVQEAYLSKKGIDLGVFSDVRYIKNNSGGDFVLPVHNCSDKIIGYQRGVKMLTPGSTHGFFYDTKKIDKKSLVYLVEGLSDYLTMVTAGYNAMAISSVVLKDPKVSEMIKTLSVGCIICFDYDGYGEDGMPASQLTGFAGAKKAVKLAKMHPSKTSLRFASTTAKRDISDVYTNKGKDGLEAVFSKENVNLNGIVNSISGDGALDESSIAEELLVRENIAYSNGNFWVCENNIWRLSGENTIKNKIMKLTQEELGVIHSKKKIEDITYYVKIKTVDSANGISGALQQNENYFKDFKDYVLLENGKYNFKKNILESYEPTDYITSTLGLTIEEESHEYPEWLKFLDSIFAGEPDKKERIAYLQQLIGYTLYPHQMFHKLFIMIGEGGNGKGVLADVMTALVGENNRTNMQISQLEGNRFSPARLQGKYLNFGTEEKRGTSLESPLLKMLTGGDRITVEQKHKESYEFTPYCKQVYSTNDEPSISENAAWLTRRLIMLSFNNTFDAGIGSNVRGDINLSARLISEKNAIFWWAIEGLKTLIQQKQFTIPSTAEKLTNDFTTGNDIVREFWKRELEMKAIELMKIRDVYKAFRTFCLDKEGVTPRYVPRKISFINRFMRMIGKGRIMKVKPTGKVDHYFQLTPEVLANSNGGFIVAQPGF